MPPASKAHLYGVQAPTKTHPDLEFLDEWLMPLHGSGLDSFASEVIAHVKQVEHRTRKRKATDEIKFQRLARCVVSNLVKAVRTPPREGGWLAVEYPNGRTKPSCYRCNAFGVPWKALSDLLESEDLIERREGLIPTDGHRGQAASIRPSSRFYALVQEIPKDQILFARAEDEPLVVLTQSEWVDGGSNGPPIKTKKWLEYKWTAKVISLSERVRAINNHIGKAKIWVEGSDYGLARATGNLGLALRRYFFVASGEKAILEQEWTLSGGRLFGGFWQTMKKAERPYIRVDGERLAEIDFRSMNAHIAYILAKAVPPDGDLYAIPGLEGYRSDVKMLFNAMLSKGPGSTITRWPNSIHDAAAKLGGAHSRTASKQAGSITRSALKPRVAANLILHHHSKIADLFMSGRIGEIQHLESETLMAALDDLRANGVVALPIHDAILIPASQVQAGQHAMASAAMRVLGVSMPTSTSLL